MLAVLLAEVRVCSRAKKSERYLSASCQDKLYRGSSDRSYFLLCFLLILSNVSYLLWFVVFFFQNGNPPCMNCV